MKANIVTLLQSICFFAIFTFSLTASADVAEVAEVAEIAEVMDESEVAYLNEAMASEELSEEAAFESYMEQAEAGDALSQYKLYCCYMNGIGVKVNKEKAMAWLKKSSDAGCSMSQRTLANDKFVGNEALTLYSKAAEQGDVEAQYELGYRYYFGFCANQDQQLGKQWLRKAAKNLDYAAPAVLLQTINLKAYGAKKPGTTRAPQNPAKPKCPMVSASDTEFLSFEVDSHEARRHYQKAADRGDAASQFVMGIWHYAEQDYAKVIDYWTKAAEQGEPRALCNLGTCYFLGKGVSINEGKALKLYKRAAEKGFEPVVEFLAIIKK